MNPLYILVVTLGTTAAVVALACGAAAAFTLAAIHRANLARDLRRAAVVEALRHPLGSAEDVARRGVAQDDPEYADLRGATVVQGHPPRGGTPMGE